MRQFRDRTVVITGAGSGMGRAYALAFAREGARLALNDFDASALGETQQQLARQGVAGMHAGVFDVADRVAMSAFAAEVERYLGGADIVINNAGIEGGGAPSWEIAAETLERVMRVNFMGVVNGTQAFLPQLLARRESALLNVSSIFGLVGTPNCSDYCASKFAVRGYTEALMTELQDSPVTVHLLHPGGIATNIARSAQTQAFSRHYLTTPPERIVAHVMACIRRKRQKIVYGQDALRAWIGSNLVPLPLLNRIIWNDMRHHFDTSAYDRIRR